MMKKSLVCIAALSAVLFGANAYAADKPQEDAATVAGQTTSQKVVSYRCQAGKSVKVTYGFNKQNLPTYAEAFVNGKTRFMPINLYRSNNMDTVFGDEDNYSLASNAFSKKNYRKTSIMVTGPSGELVFKDCKAGR